MIVPITRVFTITVNTTERMAKLCRIYVAGLVIFSTSCGNSSLAIHRRDSHESDSALLDYKKLLHTAGSVLVSLHVNA